MTGVVVIDSNLLVLLVVGTASRNYVAAHKNTKDNFNTDNFELLGLILAEFSDILLLPHVVAETSNLSRQIGGPARRRITKVLRTLVATVTEIPVPSRLGAMRSDVLDMGITDACSCTFAGCRSTGSLRPCSR